jgi:alpha-galactosidase
MFLVKKLLKVFVCCFMINIIVLGSNLLADENTQIKSPSPEIRTPKPSPAAKINGPSVFGVRPGNPFLYQIPATGNRPMLFSVENLPAGLTLDADTGRITGTIKKAGEYKVTLYAKNELGKDEKKFKIVVGETIALTPPMGWNSWNAYKATVTGENVIRAARAMVSTGLMNHGWSYVNIDDAWQDKRGGEFNAIQPNEKFPDIHKMCDEIHAMGLKVGIYSTPWTTSYAKYIGGSSDEPNGAWTQTKRFYRGKISFAENDAKQWAKWGIDYLKYDWNPKSTKPNADSSEQFHKDVETMAKALQACGRDVVYSYSNSMPYEEIEKAAALLNCWRTTGDIEDTWQSVRQKAFYMDLPKDAPNDAPLPAPSDKWAAHCKPGRWNDPDMMVIGVVNFDNYQHPTRLTPDEQYLHITQWCMAAAPLLLGCDLDQLDEFTTNLITNDEVLAVNQDSLAKQATLAGNENNTLLVYARDLEDGSKAVALYNLGSLTAQVTAKWTNLKINGKYKVRDLWRQKDLGEFEEKFSMPVASHGAEMFKLTPAAK